MAAAIAPKKKDKWLWLLLVLLLLGYWWWKSRQKPDFAAPIGTTVLDPPDQGASYYTQTASPRVEDITEASFDGINAANFSKLNAYPSSLMHYPGRGGAPYGVYDAAVRARALGEDMAPYLAELNSALHAIYGA